MSTTNHLLSNVIQRLSAHLVGFKRTGLVFMRSRDDVIHLVSVQKSKYSTANAVTFAVNLGVASRHLLQVLGDEARRPTVDRCHWRVRLASIRDRARECWWTIDAATNADSIASEVIESLEAIGLPALDLLSSEVALRDLWLEGRSPGLTSVQRLMNLSALLDKYGPTQNSGPSRQR
jgi:hypothetical protein